MIRRIVLATLAVALVGVTQQSLAAPITYVAILSGAGETPPTSPGTGIATVQLDLVAHTLDVSVTFSGLLGTTTASHIHTPRRFPSPGTQESPRRSRHSSVSPLA